MRVMSHAIESRPRLPMPIAQMGPWFFWARPDAVGLSDEDAAAIRDGVATEAQQMRAQEHAQLAMNALIAAEGPQHRRPS